MVWYNPHIDEYYKPSENADYEYLLGVGYFWFYICEL